MRRREIPIQWCIFVVSLFVLSDVNLPSQTEPTKPNGILLIQAIREHNLAEAHNILRARAKLDVFDNFGDTPLEAAISGGYTDFALELLKAGADPSFTPPGGDSPLMGAVWQRNLTLAQELLHRSVQVNAANAKGVTALMWAPHNGSDGKMVQLLLDAGADPNAKSVEGLTPLLSAAMCGDALAAEKLLKAGADPTVGDRYGKTAESEACHRGEKGHAQVCAVVRDALRKK